MDMGFGCGCAWWAIMIVGGCFACHPILGLIALIVVIFLLIKMSNEEAELRKPINTTSDISKPASPIKKANIDSSLRLSITKSTFHEKKIDHKEIYYDLLTHGVHYFYHFTDESNLDSIRKYGGLLSWKSCNTYGVEIPSAGGDTLSRQLDMRDNLQDYVRLSLCKDHPMIFRHKKEGKRLVLLKVKSEVALWKNTLFSNMNATDNNSFVGDNLEAFRKINFVAVRKTYVSRNDEDFKHHQAEILVKTVIPIEYIVNLDNPIYL